MIRKEACTSSSVSLYGKAMMVTQMESKTAMAIKKIARWRMMNEKTMRAVPGLSRRKKRNVCRPVLLRFQVLPPSS
jgi:hypothetical protein